MCSHDFSTLKSCSVGPIRALLCPHSTWLWSRVFLVWLEKYTNPIFIYQNKPWFSDDPCIFSRFYDMRLIWGFLLWERGVIKISAWALQKRRNALQSHKVPSIAQTEPHSSAQIRSRHSSPAHLTRFMTAKTATISRIITFNFHDYWSTRLLWLI